MVVAVVVTGTMGLEGRASNLQQQPILPMDPWRQGRPHIKVCDCDGRPLNAEFSSRSQGLCFNPTRLFPGTETAPLLMDRQQG